MLPPPLIKVPKKTGSERLSDYKNTQGRVPNAREKEQDRQKRNHKAAVERAAQEARERNALRQATRGELR